MTRVLVVMVMLAATTAQAHRLHPSLLQFDTDQQPIEVTWKRPIVDGVVLPLRPVFPPDCVRDAARTDRSSTVQTDRFGLECSSALTGQGVGVDGLGETGGDVIVRWLRDGETISQTLTSDRPRWIVSAASDGGWVRIGVEHIVFGFDHLAFVFGLLLLSFGVRQLVQAITAFTVGHSLTLAASVLGWAALDVAWVETMIALSIVLLAAEIVRPSKGMVARSPWLTALGCGLLHGFGFAGALGTLGLPTGDLAWALVGFNLGVEMGQLAFIGLVVGVAVLLRWAVPVSKQWAPRARWAAGYALGIAGMAWTIERAASYLAG
ncbi:MAG: hypothetical protein ACI9OJ_001065 [Myxococcota bacterium]|jgi:hypothetical protein